MSAEAAVYALLAAASSVTALVAARIYPGQLPEGVALPALVIEHKLLYGRSGAQPLPAGMVAGVVDHRTDHRTGTVDIVALTALADRWAISGTAWDARSSAAAYRECAADLRALIARNTP